MEKLRANLTSELEVGEKKGEGEMLTDGMYMPNNVQTGVMQASSFGAFTACWCHWEINPNFENLTHSLPSTS